MKKRKEVVDAIISHMSIGKSQEDVLALYLDLARTEDDDLVGSLIWIANNSELPKSQSGEKNGHYWFGLLTNKEQKKFVANWGKGDASTYLSFERYLDLNFESIGKFLRSSFTYLTSNEGLNYWLELETDLRNK